MRLFPIFFFFLMHGGGESVMLHKWRRFLRAVNITKLREVCLAPSPINILLFGFFCGCKSVFYFLNEDAKLVAGSLLMKCFSCALKYENSQASLWWFQISHFQMDFATVYILYQFISWELKTGIEWKMFSIFFSGSSISLWRPDHNNSWLCVASNNSNCLSCILL